MSEAVVRSALRLHALASTPGARAQSTRSGSRSNERADIAVIGHPHGWIRIKTDRDTLLGSLDRSTLTADSSTAVPRSSTNAIGTEAEAILPGWWGITNCRVTDVVTFTSSAKPAPTLPWIPRSSFGLSGATRCSTLWSPSAARPTPNDPVSTVGRSAPLREPDPAEGRGARRAAQPDRRPGEDPDAALPNEA